MWENFLPSFKHTCECNHAAQILLIPLALPTSHLMIDTQPFSQEGKFTIHRFKRIQCSKVSTQQNTQTLAPAGFLHPPPPPSCLLSVKVWQAAYGNFITSKMIQKQDFTWQLVGLPDDSTWLSALWHREQYSLLDDYTHTHTHTSHLTQMNQDTRFLNACIWIQLVFNSLTPTTQNDSSMYLTGLNNGDSTCFVYLCNICAKQIC